MGKAGQARKRRRAEIARVDSNITADLDNNDSTEPSPKTDFMKGLITPAELATATRVLATLNQHPEALIKDQRQHLKQLKTAVWDFQRQAATVSGTGERSFPFSRTLFQGSHSAQSRQAPL
jgi:hypothetical protein